MIEKTKDEIVFESNENKSTESCDESEYDGEVVNSAMKECKKDVVDVTVHKTGENAVIRSMNDKEYQAEVQEFNNWYYSKLDERKNSKVTDKTTKRFYDKFVPTSVLDDDVMYKQVLGNECTEDKMDKRIEASMVVPLLQAIFAMLLAIGKSLHELLQIISQSSKLSQPSLLSHPHPQPDVSPYPRSLCSCNV